MSMTTRNIIIGVLSFVTVWITISVIQSLSTRYSVVDCLTSIKTVTCE